MSLKIKKKKKKEKGKNRERVSFGVLWWLSVKDPVFSVLWLGSLLWHGIHPWPGDSCMPRAQSKKRKKKESQFQLKLVEKQALVDPGVEVSLELLNDARGINSPQPR